MQWLTLDLVCHVAPRWSILVILVDDDKGFAGAFAANFEKASKFNCSRHKGDNLVKKGAKGNKAVYEKALHAVSAEALESAKSEYSKKGAEYMAQTPDSQLYLYASGPRNCGKTSSQVSESSNAANVKMRRASIGSGLLQFFEQEMTQVLAHKEKAESYPGPLTPYAQEMVKKMDHASTNLPGGPRRVNLKQGGWAQVPSSDKAGVSYIVKGKLSCSCQKSALTTYPCDHERDVSRARNRTGEELFQDKDKVSTWKKQYSVVSLDSLVSTNEVFQEYLGPHKLPCVFKPPKGRPKANKRKKSMVELIVAKNLGKS